MNNIILLDGAIGTYLKEFKISYEDIPFLALKDEKLLISIHENYLKSGSAFINTNTFRLNPYSIKDVNLLSKLIDKSLNCANIAIKNLGFGKISYNIGPLGLDNFDNDNTIYGYYSTICSLIKHRKDISCIFIETQYMLKETLLAIEAFKNCDIPLWLSFSFNNLGLLYSGENIEQVINKVKSYNIAALGCNCGDGPKTTLNHIKEIGRFWNKPIIAKPNLGLPKEINNNLTYDISPKDFCYDMEKIIQNKATIIGGCCGTNPSYIKAISDMIKQ